MGLGLGERRADSTAWEGQGRGSSPAPTPVLSKIVRVTCASVSSPGEGRQGCTCPRTLVREGGAQRTRTMLGAHPRVFPEVPAADPEVQVDDETVYLFISSHTGPFGGQGTLIPPALLPFSLEHALPHLLQ